MTNCIRLLVVVVIFISSCKKDKIVELTNLKVRVQTLLSNYEIIWGSDFLPNGDLIFSEKQGFLYLFQIIAPLN